MSKLRTNTKYYTKGEERNTEKKARGGKKRTSGHPESSQQQHTSHYTRSIKDMATFKKNGKPTENFSP